MAAKRLLGVVRAAGLEAASRGEEGSQGVAPEIDRGEKHASPRTGPKLGLPLEPPLDAPLGPPRTPRSRGRTKARSNSEEGRPHLAPQLRPRRARGFLVGEKDIVAPAKQQARLAHRYLAHGSAQTALGPVALHRSADTLAARRVANPRSPARRIARARRPCPAGVRTAAGLQSKERPPPPRAGLGGEEVASVAECLHGRHRGQRTPRNARQERAPKGGGHRGRAPRRTPRCLLAQAQAERRLRPLRRRRASTAPPALARHAGAEPVAAGTDKPARLECSLHGRGGGRAWVAKLRGLCPSGKGARLL